MKQYNVKYKEGDIVFGLSVFLGHIKIVKGKVSKIWIKKDMITYQIIVTNVYYEIADNNIFDNKEDLMIRLNELI